MRVLLWIVLAAAGVWGSYWWIGSGTIEREVNAWFDQQSKAGMVAQNDSVTVHGFPNRFDLTVEGLSLADPATGLGWKAPFVQVFSMTWKPWHLIAALSSGQQIIFPDQTVTIDGIGMRASLELHPNSQLGLYETRLEAADLTIGSDLGWKIAAERLFGSTLELAPQSHRLGVSVTNLAPAPTLLAALASTDLPPVIETLHLDATVQFSAALDRSAVNTQPKLTELTVADLRLIWGALQMSAKGRLMAAPGGLAEGEIAIKVAGWRRLPAVLGAFGTVDPQMAPALERALEVMAKSGADPEVLTLMLKCAEGRMTLGPFPLGDAPRLN